MFAPPAARHDLAARYGPVYLAAEPLTPANLQDLSIKTVGRNAKSARLGPSARNLRSRANRGGLRPPPRSDELGQLPGFQMTPLAHGQAQRIKCELADRAAAQ